jgi:hypothetical protein
MKANYWYKDNWNGTIHEFKTLREAEQSAAKEDGNWIAIYRKDGTRAATVEATGYTYP